MPQLTQPMLSPWPYRFALLTTVCTLPLLFVGGLVTSMGVGLAVPDWPTTFGYNMFLYPWSQMVGGIFYEHSHRLLGSTVGLCTIFLALTLWMKEQRRWMRWLGVVALGAVIVQGILGGLRVVLLEHGLALIHGCFAQAFFAFLAALTLLTSAEWHNTQPRQATPEMHSLQRISIVTTAAIYLQSILGAILRHTGSGAEVHIIAAAIVALLIFWLVDWITSSDYPELVPSALLLRRLLLFQFTLGLVTYIGKYTQTGAFLASAVVLLATSHVATGALMLATSVRLSLRTYHSFTHTQLSPGLPIASEQVSA